MPSPRTYENIINANGTLIIGLPKVNGTKSDAKITDANPTTGANLNTQEVVSLITACFFINLIKSHSGCQMLTPFLPAQKAFVFLITPIIKNGTNKSIIIFIQKIVISNPQNKSYRLLPISERLNRTECTAGYYHSEFSRTW